MSGPLVSIVIDNYNYARFLAEAVDSALGQTYPHVEVVVVDDGSTDGSRDIITRYGSRVVPVFKPNGGQISACNAGYAASRGEIVHFLDADDTLEPSIVQHVVDAFAAHPEATRVQYRLRFVDRDGTPTGVLSPPQHWPMPSGDLRAHVARCRYHVRPSTSGMAYPRWVLEQIMPMPEDFHRIGPDHYQSIASALIGPIVSLNEVGGSYRLHGENDTLADRLDIDRLRQQIIRARNSHRYFRTIAERHGVNGYPEDFRDLKDPFITNARIISLKCEPRRHPIPGDHLLRAACQGMAVALRYPGESLRWRVLQGSWSVAMVVAPRAVARRLGEALMYPQRRGRLGRLSRRGQ